MKKFFMSMAAMVVAISASAQVYVGGGMGLASQKVGDGDSKLSYKLVPEIGYQFNKQWEAGLSVGWEGVEDGAHTLRLLLMLVTTSAQLSSLTSSLRVL